MKFRIVSGNERLFRFAPDWALFLLDNDGYHSWEETKEVVEGNKFQILHANRFGDLEKAWEKVTGKPAVKFEVIYDAIAAGKIKGIKLE